MQFVTSRELAAMLRISPRTIEKWGQKRNLPRVKMGRNCVRYIPADVVAWLASRGCFLGDVGEWRE